MILGYSTNAFVKYTLADALDEIAALGFRGVEIMGDTPHLYPPDYDDGRLSELKSAIAARGLTVTNINSFTLFAVGDTYLPSWIEPDPHRRRIRIQHTLDSLRIAHALGCPNISVPPGGPLETGMTRKEAFALLYEGLEQVVPTAEELGVRILVEPEPDLLMESTAEFKPFVEAVASDMVGLNFDIGHFFCVGEDPASAFETLFQWVGHVHVEDIAATREHNHLIAGRGAIDFDAMFKMMADLGYRHHMSLELYTYKDDPQGAGKESMDVLLPILARNGLDITI